MKRLQPPPLKRHTRLAAGCARILRAHRLGFGHPQRLRPLADLLRNPQTYACQTTLDLHGEQAYAFAEATTDSAILAREFATRRSGVLPPFRVVAFEQACVASKNLLLEPITRDCVLAESAITPERFARSARRDAWKWRPSVRMPGSYFLAVDRWSANYYYHWLVETLCRFLAFERLPGDVTAIVPRQTAPYMVQALALIGVDPARLTTFDDRRWRMDVCHFAEKPYRGFTCSPTDVRELRQRFLAAPQAGPAGTIPKGVYLSRGKCVTRKLANEDRVVQTLAQKGIERVYAEDLDLSEKIALFSRVETVVAPFGSGLANLLFCQPGTRVVCLYDETFFDECVYSLAEALGLSATHLALDAHGAAPVDSLLDQL